MKGKNRINESFIALGGLLSLVAFGAMSLGSLSEPEPVPQESAGLPGLKPTFMLEYGIPPKSLGGISSHSGQTSGPKGLRAVAGGKVFEGDQPVSEVIQ